MIIKGKPKSGDLEVLPQRHIKFKNLKICVHFLKKIKYNNFIKQKSTHLKL